MAEQDLYEPVKVTLEKLLAGTGRSFLLEITATKGLREKLKASIPAGREIIFAFLNKKPDLVGHLENQFGHDLLTVEVKEGPIKLDDIYQAKLYKDVLAARYGFLITTKPIPEEVKRLHAITPSILRSVGDSIYGFLAIGQFDRDKEEFVDWFEKNPFVQDWYWK